MDVPISWGLQAWEERTALTENDYIVRYSLDQSKPVFDTLFPDKPHLTCYCRYYSTFGWHLLRSMSRRPEERASLGAARHAKRDFYFSSNTHLGASIVRHYQIPEVSAKIEACCSSMTKMNTDKAANSSRRHHPNP